MLELMNQSQTCEMLGISKDTFWAMCKSGELPAVKIGRRWYVPKAELMRVVSEKLKQAKEVMA